MSSSPLPFDQRTHPPPAVRFTDREVELAHQLAALGIDWEPAAGTFVYDDENRFPDPSPFQPHVYILLDYPRFLELSGGYDGLRRHWTWLPTWDDGRAWLNAHGKTNAEILDRVRERVVDNGLTDREALYELMVATLRAEREM